MHVIHITEERESHLIRAEGGEREKEEWKKKAVEEEEEVQDVDKEETEKKCQCGWIIVTVTDKTGKQGPDHRQPCAI